jgi:hypothetical protein
MRRRRGLWHTVWLNIFTGHFAEVKILHKIWSSNCLIFYFLFSVGMTYKEEKIESGNDVSEKKRRRWGSDGGVYPSLKPESLLCMLW